MLKSVRYGYQAFYRTISRDFSAKSGGPEKKRTTIDGFLRPSRYAKPTVDTAFKLMLFPGLHGDKSVLISFLNSFIPSLRNDPIVEITEMPVALPPLPEPAKKQTFMDLHVVCNNGGRFIIEVQNRRHVMFDERALFYASSTYSRQLPENLQEQEDWYCLLKPVIALQILDYDSNRIKGIKSMPKGVSDTLLQRVKLAPMQADQFIKHYVLRDKFSGQVIDFMELIQIELPRADRIMDLSTPRHDFTDQEWWLSILLHSQNYTYKKVEAMHKSGSMPEVIYNALARLDFKKWNPGVMKEYYKDMEDISKYALMFAARDEEVRTAVTAEVTAEVTTKVTAEVTTRERTEMVRRMLDRNMPIGEIAVFADVTEAFVQSVIEDRSSNKKL